MRWYRLADFERRSLRAPRELDAFGLLALTMLDRWERNAIFVLVKAFVDESGTGGQPRVMLGALVARAQCWHGFNKQWWKLLDREQVEFSHIVAMENKKKPFRDWGLKRTVPFVAQAGPLLKRHLDFGTTVAVSLDDYKHVYLGTLPDNARKESPYGLCARALIEAVTCECVAAFGKNTVVNFVFEDTKDFSSALMAFKDLKEHVPILTPHLGQIAPGAKKEVPGLMAADLVASLGRRSEPTAAFSPVEEGTCRVPREHGRIPMFHVPMDGLRLLQFSAQASEIAREKRFAKAQAKKAKRSA